ncbi:MAG: endolytic transglycosylase MltG [Bacteroidaceae bacterium]|nr:endolytic transglycosylase MltG [Bacteroidaceae bacterium]
MNKTKKYLLSFVSVVIIALGAAIFWGWKNLVSSPFEITETVYIYVRPMDTEDSIRRQLTDVAKARSLYGWTIARWLTDFQPHTGRYAVEPGESLLNVYRHLKHGHQAPVRFTVPSVRRLEKLAGVMAQKLMLDSADVAFAFSDSIFASNYGYKVATLPALFIPNTYELYWNTSLEGFMERMQRENATFWDAEGRNEAAQQMGMSHEEVITLASIIDEETANNSEKPRVAGMYLNRLRTGMPLQADPTVKFALHNDTLRRIRMEHLRAESPYNTYLHPGLPPGPIRIPSVAGIDAVLRHETHDYLYMCAKEDFSGTHNFASSYSDHLKNARRYQQALNQRGIR